MQSRPKKLQDMFNFVIMYLTDFATFGSSFKPPFRILQKFTRDRKGGFQIVSLEIMNSYFLNTILINILNFIPETLKCKH